MKTKAVTERRVTVFDKAQVTGLTPAPMQEDEVECTLEVADDALGCLDMLLDAGLKAAPQDLQCQGYVQPWIPWLRQ